MERKSPGVVSSYLLNLMVHSDTLRMSEIDIRQRIEKRFKKGKTRRLRPQNVRIFHLEPLVRRGWLRLLPDGRYERIGELRHVTPRQTLYDQFVNDDPELEPYIDAYIHSTEFNEFNRKLFGAENFEDSLTEEEYKRYMEKLYGD